MALPARICVLSDSHAASLKRGSSLIKDDFPDTDFTFFAGTSAEWNSLRAMGGKLVPESATLREQFGRSAHGLTEITDDFDAYIVCGMGLAMSVALKFWVRLQDKDWAMERAGVAWHIGNLGCAHALATLRTITDKPAMLLAAPFQPRKFCLFSSSIDDADAAQIRTIFFEECEALAAKHGAMFVPQPENTWAPNGVTTKMKFASTELLNGKEDRRHCTPQYGAIVLAEVLKRFAAA